MSFELLKVGYCLHPEAVVSPGAPWRQIRFPSTVGLIRHPIKGVILFDTGYSTRFATATQRFPELLYAKLTPITLTPQEELLSQLAQRDIAPEDVRYIFISHFHADHIAGLQDFPQAQFICSQSALHAIESMGRWRGLTKGYLKKLLPEDMATRTTFLEGTQLIKLANGYKPFDCAHDILGDGSLLAISLPGHAHGHFGLLLANQSRPVFLVGDACWLSRNYQERSVPNRLTSLIMNSRHAYVDTLHKLSDLYCDNDNVNIVPSHCLKKYEELNQC